MKRGADGGYTTAEGKLPGFKITIITFAVMLAMSGVHFGLIVLGIACEWHYMAQILVPTAYWAVMAVIFAANTRLQLKKNYDEPLRELGRGAQKVARGDFSVYLKPRHTEDTLDCLDTIYLDFNKMVEELGSMETMKTEFFSNVSHEMKAPLAVISSSLELIKQGELSESEVDQQIDTALSASRRMSGLIDNMLRLNKLEHQRIAPKSETYNLTEQLSECAVSLENLWESKDLELEADMEDEAMIDSDRELLEIVWRNLLTNAIKFTDSGGKIAISQRSEGDKVIVSVADTGCGMSEETIERVFDKFYQGDTSHSSEGNGLGLALVKRILELLNGEISIESEPGKGSVFTVELEKAGAESYYGGEE